MLFFFNNYVLDADRRELRRGASAVPVEPQVFDLLVYLIKNRERVVSKDDLRASIWSDRTVSDSTLGTRINAARRAIGDNGAKQRLIRTLPRKGLRFVAAVREQSETGMFDSRHSTPDPPDVALSVSGRPSITVLAFANISGDREQDCFAKGMADEIIAALIRCPWLFVIARGSSFTRRGRPVDIRRVGRELGVRYVLAGSVRRAGNRLRFTGQLIDATNGMHVWSDWFEGQINDVLELQDRFTEAVVAAVVPKVQLAEIERLKHKSAANFNAYELHLRALQLTYEFTDASFAGALRHLNQAFMVDPSYAPAMALAAYCYAERSAQGWTQDLEAEASEGMRLAQRAMQIANHDPNIFWMAAYAVWRLRADAHAARELARRSLQLNANSPAALAVLGRIEHALGNGGRALELLGRAERLSPGNPRQWFVRTGLAAAHLSEGKMAQAVSAANAALSQNPCSVIALRVRAAGLAKLGKQAGAANAIRDLRHVDPTMTISKLCAQKSYIVGGWWSEYLGALRLAGLPDH